MKNKYGRGILTLAILVLPFCAFNLVQADTYTLAQNTNTSSSTIYYVDYIDGSDSNSGTSPLSPWQHSPGDPNAVGNPQAVVLKPGDTIVFKGGVVYQFPSSGGYIAAKASGSPGSPITYISGHLLPTPWPDSTSRAIIDGTNSTSDYKDVTKNGIISLSNYSWIVIKGLEIRDSPPFVNSYQMAYTGGISWAGSSGGNITIENNYIHDLAMDGIYLLGKWSAAGANEVPSNFYIIGNTIIKTNGHGLLQRWGFNNVVIENNTFDLNGVDFKNTGEPDIQADNIFLSAYDTNGSIQYNTVIRNNIFKDAPTKSHILFANQKNINIYGNVFTGEAAVASIDIGWLNQGINIFNNVFNDNIYIYQGPLTFYAVSPDTFHGEVNIFQNTFVASPAHGAVIGFRSGKGSNIKILNNIIDANPDSGNFEKFGYQINIIFDTGVIDYSTLEINNNVYNSAMSRPFKVDGSYHDLSSWKVALQQKGVSGYDSNSTFGAVSFANRTEGDFHLSSNDTLARGKGINLSSYCSIIPALCFDKDGNSRPSTGNWDIGAYQYVSSIFLGDISGDNQISAYDAALAAQYSVGLISLNQEQIQKAEVSGDKQVTAYDAALIAQRAVGLIGKFPVEG